MGTITKTVNGKRVTFKTKESPAEFSRRLKSRRLARRKAQQIKRRGGQARVETIKGESVVVQVKAPELFTKEGKKAKPDVKGVIRGFSRADLTKMRSQEAQRQKLLKEFREKTTRQTIRGKITPGIIQRDLKIQKFKPTPKMKVQFPKKLEEVKPSTKDVLRIIEQTKRGEFRGQRVQLGKLKSGDILAKQETQSEKVIRNLTKFDKGIADKLGTQKVSTSLKKFSVKSFRGEKNIPFPEKVSLNIITDVLERPLTNIGIIAGAGAISKGIGFAGLKYQKLAGKLAKKSPKLAKRLGVSTKLLKKGTGALIGTVYGASIIKEGLEEKKKTGKIDKTTAKLIRELMLFSIGSKLGTSVKTQKLTQLQKEFNKLPKGQQKSLQNKLNKISKASPKLFKAKDLGLTKQLDKLQIKKSLSKGLIREDVLVVTKNKLFFVKKGNIPKRTKTFFVNVVGIESKGKKGLKVLSGSKAKIKVKYNSKTGKITPVGRVSFDKLDVRKANALIKRIRPGEIIKTRRVPVKAFQKRVIRKGAELIPKLKIEKKKIVKKLVAKKLKVKVEVKPSKRKIKEVLEAKLKTTTKKGKDVVIDGEKLQFLQFTPTKRVKKPKPVKIEKLKKKFDKLFLFGKKGALILKKTKTKTKVVSKPKIISEVKVIKGEKDLKILPIPLIKPKVSKPRISKIKPKITIKTLKKPKIISKINKKAITKPVSKQVKILKPKNSVTPASKKKPKTRPITKPKIKIISAQAKAIKPKIAVKTIALQKTRRKSLIPRLIKIKPKIKPKLLPLIKKKKAKKKFVKKKKAKKSKLITFFTPTITRPIKKSKKELKKEEKLQLFTGLEFRG